MSFFSIIIPTYNSSSFLKNAIKSIQNQSYKNFEVIFVDDASTDNTVQIIHDFMIEDGRAKFAAMECNSGPASARMRAFELVTSPFVVALDSDDHIASDYLNFLYTAIKEDKEERFDIFIANLMVQQEFGSDYSSFNEICNLKDGQVFSGIEAFAKTFPWSIHPHGAVRTSVLRKVAESVNNKHSNHHYDEFITRLIFLRSRFVKVENKSLYYYQKRKNSVSQSFSIKRWGELEVDELLIEMLEKMGLHELSHIQRDIQFKKFKILEQNFNYRDANFKDVGHFIELKNIYRSKFHSLGYEKT